MGLWLSTIAKGVRVGWGVCGGGPAVFLILFVLKSFTKSFVCCVALLPKLRVWVGCLVRDSLLVGVYVCVCVFASVSVGSCVHVFTSAKSHRLFQQAMRVCLCIPALVLTFTWVYV